MFGKKDIKRLELKVDELTERVRLISERQNSQYTDMMLILKKKEASGEIDNRSIEEIYEDVREETISLGKVSTSYIQRMERIGYAKAAQIMDMLEERGVIEKGDGARPRNVLIKPEKL